MGLRNSLCSLFWAAAMSHVHSFHKRCVWSEHTPGVSSPVLWLSADALGMQRFMGEM